MKKFSSLGKILSKEAQRSIFGGYDDDDLAPVCVACTADSSCSNPKTPECRASTSCPNDPKVCAKKQFA